MAVDITVEINTLRTATYGEEVRESLATALDKLQKGVNSSTGGGPNILYNSGLVIRSNDVGGLVGIIERVD